MKLQTKESTKVQNKPKSPSVQKSQPSSNQSKLQQNAMQPKNASNPNTSATAPATNQKYPVEYWTAVENEIVTLCNQERVKAGISPVQINESLRKIARYKSNEMLQYNYFSHSSTVTGYMPWDLAKKIFGYSYSTFGENLWMTKMSSDNPRLVEQFRSNITAREIVKDWMNSPSHKANILNKNFKKIGVGLAYSSSLKAYAAQEFSN